MDNDKDRVEFDKFIMHEIKRLNRYDYKDVQALASKAQLPANLKKHDMAVIIALKNLGSTKQLEQAIERIKSERALRRKEKERSAHFTRAEADSVTSTAENAQDSDFEDSTLDDEDVDFSCSNLANKSKLSSSHLHSTTGKTLKLAQFSTTPSSIADPTPLLRSRALEHKLPRLMGNSKSGILSGKVSKTGRLVKERRDFCFVYGKRAAELVAESTKPHAEKRIFTSSNQDRNNNSNRNLPVRFKGSDLSVRSRSNLGQSPQLEAQLNLPRSSHSWSTPLSYAEKGCSEKSNYNFQQFDQVEEVNTNSVMHRALSAESQHRELPPPYPNHKWPSRTTSQYAKSACQPTVSLGASEALPSTGVAQSSHSLRQYFELHSRSQTLGVASRCCPYTKPQPVQQFCPPEHPPYSEPFKPQYNVEEYQQDYQPTYGSQHVSQDLHARQQVSQDFYENQQVSHDFYGRHGASQDFYGKQHVSRGLVEKPLFSQGANNSRECLFNQMNEDGSSHSQYVEDGNVDRYPGPRSNLQINKNVEDDSVNGYPEPQSDLPIYKYAEHDNMYSYPGSQSNLQINKVQSLSLNSDMFQFVPTSSPSTQQNSDLILRPIFHLEKKLSELNLPLQSSVTKNIAETISSTIYLSPVCATGFPRIPPNSASYFPKSSGMDSTDQPISETLCQDLLLDELKDQPHQQLPFSEFRGQNNQLSYPMIYEYLMSAEEQVDTLPRGRSDCQLPMQDVCEKPSRLPQLDVLQPSDVPMETAETPLSVVTNLQSNDAALDPLLDLAEISPRNFSDALETVVKGDSSMKQVVAVFSTQLGDTMTLNVSREESEVISPESPKVSDSPAELPELSDTSLELPKVSFNPLELPKAYDSPAELPELSDTSLELPKVSFNPLELPKASDSPPDLPELSDTSLELPKVSFNPLELPKAYDSPLELSQVSDKKQELLNVSFNALEPLKVSDSPTEPSKVFAEMDVSNELGKIKPLLREDPSLAVVEYDPRRVAFFSMSCLNKTAVEESVLSLSPVSTELVTPNSSVLSDILSLSQVSTELESTSNSAAMPARVLSASQASTALVTPPSPATLSAETVGVWTLSKSTSIRTYSKTSSLSDYLSNSASNVTLDKPSNLSMDTEEPNCPSENTTKESTEATSSPKDVTEFKTNEVETMARSSRSKIPPGKSPRQPVRCSPRNAARALRNLKRPGSPLSSPAKGRKPCANEHRGCAVILPPAQLSSHELICECALVHCPVTDCQWNNNAKRLCAHLREQHRHLITVGADSSHTVNVSEIQEKKHINFLREVTRKLFVLGIHFSADIIYVTIQYVASARPGRPVLASGSLEVLDADRKPHSWRGKICAIQQDHSLMRAWGNCLEVKMSDLGDTGEKLTVHANVKLASKSADSLLGD